VVRVTSFLGRRSATAVARQSTPQGVPPGRLQSSSDSERVPKARLGLPPNRQPATHRPDGDGEGTATASLRDGEEPKPRFAGENDSVSPGGGRGGSAVGVLGESAHRKWRPRDREREELMMM